MSECTCDDIILELTPEGQDGNGIVSVEKISTVGVISTYRITFTNGTYFDYQITDGSSIATIEKTGTSGLVDTYTVTLTNGDTSSFTVTNGNGIASIVKTGSTGLVDSYRITFTDGTHYDYTVTNGAKGDPGDTGNGIVSITKTGTAGLVDTYTILFSDGTTTTYTVTNGEQGEPGEAGNGIESIEKTGSSGLTDTYRITFTDGDHFDYDVTNGEDGEPGPTGNGIASIEKISTVGLVDTYRITFTDGTHFDYDVTNGSSSGGSSWGSITGTLSDQTDLQSALDSKADIIKASASGSVVSITDGAPYAVDALSVGVDAVQDLHGYDAPWPAGGGANQWDEQIVTTGYFNTDGTWASSGGAIISSKNPIPVQPETQYYLHIGTGENVFLTYWTQAVPSGISDTEHFISRTTAIHNQTFTTPAGCYAVHFNIGSAYGSTYKNNVSVNYPSTVTTYSPYANVCPISGHSEAKITRTKNIIQNINDTTKTVNGVTFTINSDKSITLSGTTTSNVFYNLDFVNNFNNAVCDISKFRGMQMCISLIPTAISGVDITFNYFDGNGSNQTLNGVSNITTYASFVVPSNAVKSRICIRVSSGADFTTPITVYPMLEVGNAPTAYQETFAPVTIDLGAERFGGVLDVKAGTLTVTNANISSYNGETLPSTWISDRDVYSAGATPTTGAQVVYKLATPQTVTGLTPAQISTLLGNNVLWADTGNIDLTYRADTAKYIDRKVAEANTLTRAMIADSATADGKAPKSLSTGDLIIVGDELRKATSNIGSGSAITNSNSTTATLADVIKALQ